MNTEEDEFKRIEREALRQNYQSKGTSMTTLQQAAQQALEALIDAANVLSAPMFADAADALRKALAQPEQEPSQWRDMVVVSLVREGIDKHRARELSDHFAAQRPWQGLTDEDKQTAVWTDGTFGGGALWAQQLPKESNG